MDNNQELVTEEAESGAVDASSGQRSAMPPQTCILCQETSGAITIGEEKQDEKEYKGAMGLCGNIRLSGFINNRLVAVNSKDTNTMKGYIERQRASDDPALAQWKTAMKAQEELFSPNDQGGEATNADSILLSGGGVITSCGHAMHHDCHGRYLASLTNSRSLYEARVSPHLADASKGEFLCPLCKKANNTLLPYVWQPYVHDNADSAADTKVSADMKHNIYLDNDDAFMDDEFIKLIRSLQDPLKRNDLLETDFAADKTVAMATSGSAAAGGTTAVTDASPLSRNISSAAGIFGGLGIWGMNAPERDNRFVVRREDPATATTAAQRNTSSRVTRVAATVREPNASEREEHNTSWKAFVNMWLPKPNMFYSFGVACDGISKSLKREITQRSVNRVVRTFDSMVDVLQYTIRTTVASAEALSAAEGTVNEDFLSSSLTSRQETCLRGLCHVLNLLRHKLPVDTLFRDIAVLNIATLVAMGTEPSPGRVHGQQMHARRLLHLDPFSVLTQTLYTLIPNQMKSKKSAQHLLEVLYLATCVQTCVAIHYTFNHGGRAARALERAMETAHLECVSASGSDDATSSECIEGLYRLVDESVHRCSPLTSTKPYTPSAVVMATNMQHLAAYARKASLGYLQCTTVLVHVFIDPTRASPPLLSANTKGPALDADVDMDGDAMSASTAVLDETSTAWVRECVSIEAYLGIRGLRRRVQRELATHTYESTDSTQRHHESTTGLVYAPLVDCWCDSVYKDRLLLAPKAPDTTVDAQSVQGPGASPEMVYRFIDQSPPDRTYTALASGLGCATQGSGSRPALAHTIVPPSTGEGRAAPEPGRLTATPARSQPTTTSTPTPSSSATATSTDERTGFWDPKRALLPVRVKQLIPLPADFNDLFHDATNVKCAQCNQTPVDPALCLSCGVYVCAKSACCTVGGVGECNAHARRCGAGVGVFFVLKKCMVLLLASGRGCPYPSMYLDSHGERDFGLRRGHPLHLNTFLYAALERLWLSLSIKDEIIRHNDATAAYHLRSWLDY
ncbi:hypothetical protein SARC_00627 [Sphaeroforma arctica JP610]|uniref:E3 ubiquitin-protein ligase n=1 Tax=Sphaeroforma arctica JP610 TaxID=667725 RepID=A0A0L0GEC6_9EUKA|nr:hypothetical protein SARC_00627 [Sphaeroforma arctica JP610]KNC87241.1 hypothetical protein SARC_00627 [Sphaeroforma arctica JP610]|eukprot:XP_014161143.1 hypothetical protein SARC_00627 [Sphaeroforma arctica JP610]